MSELNVGGQEQGPAPFAWYDDSIELEHHYLMIEESWRAELGCELDDDLQKQVMKNFHNDVLDAIEGEITPHTRPNLDELTAEELRRFHITESYNYIRTMLGSYGNPALTLQDEVYVIKMARTHAIMREHTQDGQPGLPTEVAEFLADTRPVSPLWQEIIRKLFTDSSDTASG
jgi:hypothetical protein